METHQNELLRLSETARDLPEFLKEACALLGISFRQASLQVGLSHAAVWNLVVGHTKKGDADTIARLALFFKVPEVNLRKLTGLGPDRIRPTHRLKEAEAIYQTLSDEEKEHWIWLGELLIRARTPSPAAKKSK